MGIPQLIGQLFFFFLPAGFANMAPVLFKKHFVFLAKPIDAGHLLWGQQIFGSHKTWRGIIVATLAGGLLFLIERWLVEAIPQFSSASPFDLRDLPWWFGFLFGLGAICGDLLKSFFKRRFHVHDGTSWFPFDQIDFLIGASVVASFFVHFTALMWLIIVAVGILMHILVNHIAYWLKLKDTPW